MNDVYLNIYLESKFDNTKLVSVFWNMEVKTSEFDAHFKAETAPKVSPREPLSAFVAGFKLIPGHEEFLYKLEGRLINSGIDINRLVDPNVARITGYDCYLGGIPKYYVKIIKPITSAYDESVDEIKPKPNNSWGKPQGIEFLPGLKETVKHPCSGRQFELEEVIISLNDDYEWSREDIAAWLDTLDIDLNFK